MGDDLLLVTKFFLTSVIFLLTFNCCADASELAYQVDDEDAPAVFFTRSITPDGLERVYKALRWEADGRTAVKISTGEPPASNYLRPALIRDFVKRLKGTIIECNTAYNGSRAETAMHLQVAKDHGFTEFANVDIMDSEGDIELPVTHGTHLTGNFVGKNFTNYNSFVILSHFKGHAMAGFGGAVKNTSIGIASRRGKCRIHTGGKSDTSPWGGTQNAFLESMAEAARSVSDYLEHGRRIVYINVMNRLSIDCDCNGHPAEPDIHDIGILSSKDPVALDQACVDLINAASGNHSFVKRMRQLNAVHVLEHAENMKLGSRHYRLIYID